MTYRHTSAAEDAIDDAMQARQEHLRRMQQNWDHYTAELATKTTHQCRAHYCFEEITEGGYCVKHNARRWD